MSAKMTQNFGKITIFLDQLVGTGSSSNVFIGRLGERQVAVKKVSKNFMKLINSEIKQLEKSDGHTNIIRYYLAEEDMEYYYIALEECQYNLKAYIKNASLQQQLSLKVLLNQIFCGLEWLHGLRIGKNN